VTPRQRKPSWRSSDRRSRQPACAAAARIAASQNASRCAVAISSASNSTSTVVSATSKLSDHCDDRCARLPCAATRLANEDDEEFAEHLHRHDDLVISTGIKERNRRGLALLAVHPLGVGKDVGVQRDPHAPDQRS
jgi:hypothetical protein